MSHIYELHRFVMNEIPKLIESRVLDVGCGHGIWGFLMRSERSGEESYIVGVDLFKPYLQHCKKYRVYNDLVLCHASKLPFRKKSFDLILACELIEHLSKHDGYHFLDDIEKIGTKIILSSPNGFKEQKAKDIPYTEAHKSAWGPPDFISRGYKVHGLGFKFIKIYESNPYLWGFLFYIFTPFSFLVPDLGEYLIAKK